LLIILLKKPANLNDALIIATENNHIKVIRLLLDNGTDYLNRDMMGAARGDQRFGKILYNHDKCDKGWS